MWHIHRIEYRLDFTREEILGQTLWHTNVISAEVGGSQVGCQLGLHSKNLL